MKTNIFQRATQIFQRIFQRESAIYPDNLDEVIPIIVMDRQRLEDIPLGSPVSSIVPQEGYGNHSCRDCLATLCLVFPLLDEEYGEPNQCSFYWPPNMPDWKVPAWYYPALEKIAKEMQGKSKNAR